MMMAVMMMMRSNSTNQFGPDEDLLRTLWWWRQRCNDDDGDNYDMDTNQFGSDEDLSGDNCDDCIKNQWASLFRKWSQVKIVPSATKIIMKHKRSPIYSSPTSHDVVLAQRLQRSSSYFLSGVRVCFGCKNGILMFIVRRIVIITTSINIHKDKSITTYIFFLPSAFFLQMIWIIQMGWPFAKATVHYKAIFILRMIWPFWRDKK